MVNADLEQAASFYAHGEWKEAFRIYKKEAEAGCVECQRFIGWMYFRGDGVKVDLEKATYWLEKAANSGDMEATFGLGRIYMSKKEYINAYNWYEEGANRDFLPSIYWVARFNRDGYGVERNEEKAFLLFQRGALFGHLKSLREYSIMLLSGKRGILKAPLGFYCFLKLLFLTIRQAIKDPLDYKGMI
jgi:TPR repeat protein